MSTTSSSLGSPVQGTAGPDPRRWRALAVLALIQFMLVLDMTVVNVALPKIQDDLHFSQSGLAWVVNGYVLMAGGLLLLGGRLADMHGRRRLFLAGVAVFAVASATSGAAVNPTMLVASRFAQGVGQALAAPAALGLIALLFTDTKERMKALGIWGGIAGLAGTFGTVISGVLTDFASWRWIFYINLPVAVFTLLIVPQLVSESQMNRERGRLDYGGAVTATGGLVAIVYGLLNASSHAWGSWQVLLPLIGGVGLLVLMVAIEANVKSPIIPLQFFNNRTRVTANFATLLLSSAFFGFFFLLTLFEQQVLGYSPLRGGLSYLPLGLGMGVGITLSTSLMPRIGVKPVLTIGLFGAAVGVLLTSFIHVGASYWVDVLPGMVVLGIFCGMCFPATANASLHEVTGQNSSLASGMQSTMQQVGGALGLAVLITIALRFAAGRGSRGPAYLVAITGGYALSLRVAACILCVAALVVLFNLGRVRTQRRRPAAQEPVDAPPVVPEPAES